MAVPSPFFRQLPLQAHGVEWVFPPVPLAHPLDNGDAVALERDLAATARGLECDAGAYRRLFEPYVERWDALIRAALRPMLTIPGHPFFLAGFGLRAFQPASLLARTLFKTERARALFAGVAAHSFLRLEQPLSSAFALMLMVAAHASGWPLVKGGSQSLTRALVSILRESGGRVHTNSLVTSLDELGKPDVICCDVTPRQFLALAGKRLPRGFRRKLDRYRYGPGVFKVDWALRDPIPWRSPVCRFAGTVHLGGSFEEIAASERAASGSTPSPKPFVILAQPTLFDPTRAPEGKHIAWAYCHVPNGWAGSHLDALENQVERFAPGFRGCILARHTATAPEMEAMNPNLVGGDINGGLANLRQFVFRPTWWQYNTPLPGVFLCSSSTPPGGGVHGMCGFHAATRALRWLEHRA